MHATVQPCKGCHTLMDPIGFGFENYDGIGQWRTTDEGQPVDASGSLTGTDSDGNFNGAVDLAHKLVQAKDPQEAFALQSEYLKAQLAALQEQAKEIGTLIQKNAITGSK